MSEKIESQHLQRKAVFYVRQSSSFQVQHSEESRRLQYAMQQHLRNLGGKCVGVSFTGWDWDSACNELLPSPSSGSKSRLCLSLEELMLRKKLNLSTKLYLVLRPLRSPMDVKTSTAICDGQYRRERWTNCLGISPNRHHDSTQLLVGVLPGEGIGPEVIACALKVLSSALNSNRSELKVEYGGSIGRDSEAICGKSLPADVIEFCEGVFDRGGAILNGPGGGRYVYDLRREFDLFFKISPLQAQAALFEASPFQPHLLSGLDILVIRENSGGVYQGDWEYRCAEEPVASHHFEYRANQVERFVEASAKLAKQRRGEMTIVWKESGIPAISQLWRDCAERATDRFDVEYTMVDIDLMAYQLIKEPSTFDVLVTPNLFGDILGDLGAVMLGSRGVSFSGNFNAQKCAVYQTNHGAAYDLAGKDRANPIGQIFSVSMMLRESFGLFDEAEAIEQAVRDVWKDGWRTADMETESARVVGTQEMGDLIARRIAERIDSLKSVA